MGFFARIASLFHSAEVERLREQVRSYEEVRAVEKDFYLTVRKERDWFRDELAREVKAARRRDQETVNLILREKNVPTLPLSETVKAAEKIEKTSLTADEIAALEKRAADYCLADIGADYTKDDYDTTLRSMKANPSDWLND